MKPTINISNKLLEYIDLGLPSGTLWKASNEPDFYTYDEALQKFGSQLPTIHQFRELVNYCQFNWVEQVEDKNYNYITEDKDILIPIHLEFIGPSGNKIFLPADGALEGEENPVWDDMGLYWTSASVNNQKAVYMLINHIAKTSVSIEKSLRRARLSVRLVN